MNEFLQASLIIIICLVLIFGAIFLLNNPILKRENICNEKLGLEQINHFKLMSDYERIFIEVNNEFYNCCISNAILNEDGMYEIKRECVGFRK